MGENVLERMDEVMKRAGTDDPFELADYLGARIMWLTGSVIGFVRKIKQRVFIGVHRELSPRKQRFTVMHEDTHIVCHLEAEEFRLGHQEAAFFSAGSGIFDATVSRQEKEANLASAEYSLPTDEVLDMIGYYNSEKRKYRRKLAEHETLRQKYEGYKYSCNYGKYSPTVKERLATYETNLRDLAWELEDLRSSLGATDNDLTIEQIARVLHVSTVMVEYKLAALRLRGYDFDDMDLPGYDRVFRERL